MRIEFFYTSFYISDFFNLLPFYVYRGFHFQNYSIHLLNSFFNPNKISKNPLVENNLVLAANS